MAMIRKEPILQAPVAVRRRERRINEELEMANALHFRGFDQDSTLPDKLHKVVEEANEEGESSNPHHHYDDETTHDGPSMHSTVSSSEGAALSDWLSTLPPTSTNNTVFSENQLVVVNRTSQDFQDEDSEDNVPLASYLPRNMRATTQPTESAASISIASGDTYHYDDGDIAQWQTHAQLYSNTTRQATGYHTNYYPHGELSGTGTMQWPWNQPQFNNNTFQPQAIFPWTPAITQTIGIPAPHACTSITQLNNHEEQVQQRNPDLESVVQQNPSTTTATSTIAKIKATYRMWRESGYFAAAIAVVLCAAMIIGCISAVIYRVAVDSRGGI